MVKQQFPCPCISSPAITGWLSANKYTSLFPPENTTLYTPYPASATTLQVPRHRSPQCLSPISLVSFSADPFQLFSARAILLPLLLLRSSRTSTLLQPIFWPSSNLSYQQNWLWLMTFLIPFLHLALGYYRYLLFLPPDSLSLLNFL